MLCKNCGAALPDGADVCMKCGAGVDGPFPDAEELVKKDKDGTAETSGAVNGLMDGEHEASEEVVGVLEEEPDDADRTGGAAEKNFSTMPAPKGVKVAEVPVRAPETPSVPDGGEQEKKPPRASEGGAAGRVILSVFLSILLSLSLLASTVVTVLRACVSDTNIRSAVSDLQISTLRLDIRMKDTGRSDSVALATDGSALARIAAAPAVSPSGSGVYDNLTDYFYAFVQSEPGWENVRKRDIREALESPLAKEFLAEIADDYAAVFMDGERAAGKGLTPERITDFVMDHEDEIGVLLKEMGYTGLFKPDAGRFEDDVREEMPEELRAYSPERIVETYPGCVNVFRIAVSVPATVCFWILTAVLIALIVLVNRRRISAVFTGVGVPALVLGLVFLVGWSAMTLVPAMKDGLWSLIPQFTGRNVLIAGAGLAGGGLVLTITGSVIRSVRRRRRS